jgi:hypothetical protein
MSEKTVTYDFSVRSGAVRYTSRYTPPPEKQPGNLPDAWWKGNAPVEIRISKSALLMKLPDGHEVASRILGQTPAGK